jgi:putative ABC transport system substrate-binding protein
MNRRDSVRALLAALALGGPSALAGQPRGARAPSVIGLLPDLPQGSPMLKLLVDELAQLGRVEGRDYVFHRSGIRYGGDAAAALERVMGAGPDLVLTSNLGFAIAAQRVSKTLPIVMWVSGFPVEGGVADSLARPGRNVTGMTIYAGGEVFGKLVQLLHEAKPGIKRIGALMSYVPPFHPRAEADVIIRGMRDAAGPLGVDLRIFEVSKPEHIDEALAQVASQRIEGLVLTSDPVMMPRRREILRFANERRIPAIIDVPWDAIWPTRPLLGYWADFASLMRQAAPYVDKILWRGAKPGDLPIQLPARFVLEIDLNNADEIGLDVPKPLLLRADRVVERQPAGPGPQPLSPPSRPTP